MRERSPWLLIQSGYASCVKYMPHFMAYVELVNTLQANIRTTIILIQQAN